MIAVDSSILVGVIRGERDLDRFVDLPFREEIAVAAPALVEVRAWCARNLRGGASEWLTAATASSSVLIAPFTAPMAEVASDAFRRMGRGAGHPAALNFGDALVYGHAVVAGLPLLFKGGDFGHAGLALDPRSVFIG